MTVSTGPSEYMCRRKGGKDRDKGQKQERENTVQGSKEIAKIFIMSNNNNRKEKAFQLLCICQRYSNE